MCFFSFLSFLTFLFFSELCEPRLLFIIREKVKKLKKLKKHKVLGPKQTKPLKTSLTSQYPHPNNFMNAKRYIIITCTNKVFRGTTIMHMSSFIYHCTYYIHINIYIYIYTSMPLHINVCRHHCIYISMLLQNVICTCHAHHVSMFLHIMSHL